MLAYCDFCRYSYRVIGKAETSEADTRFVLNRIRAKRNMEGIDRVSKFDKIV